MLPSATNPDVPPGSAIIRKITREDVLWNRRVFKAPPLEVQTPVPDLREFGYPLVKRDANSPAKE